MQIKKIDNTHIFFLHEIEPDIIYNRNVFRYERLHYIHKLHKTIEKLIPKISIFDIK